MAKVEVPLDSQGAPIGAPGPAGAIYLRVPPYCCGPEAGVVAVTEGAGLVEAGEVWVGVEEAGDEVVGGAEDAAGLVGDDVAELQPAAASATASKTIMGTISFFILPPHFL